ncbi:urease accessory protein UreF [Marinomonas sp. 15G1-11]|uniref:Urease accessory protein UreF n=1 Tax=Marinomonas phaeophyticola TaxID=3004091 RepID=A0ABT4JSM1_9GAMM|nr:urease accessory UreF family protein [Marinomonas sp. 15G1-11]MCZ2721359.1 urease accessory protein UreF [Marinomonas sp. 15G1-11]
MATSIINATSATTDLSLLRLLQLSSVSLPVGGFSFSQGLEYAIDSGWINNAPQVSHWVETQLTESLARLDLPVLKLAMQSLARTDCSDITLSQCNDLILACRETKELKLTDTAMGEALSRLLRSLDIPLPFEKGEDVSFVVLFAVAAHHWNISFHTTALGFSWSWLENQIAAATKLVPLGQTQAQQLLGELQRGIPVAIRVSETVTTEDIGAGLPAIAIASARHETQYSRLFRS